MMGHSQRMFKKVKMKNVKTAETKNGLPKA